MRKCHGPTLGVRARVCSISPAVSVSSLEYGWLLLQCAGVMCLDFNPEQPHLLAAGCYDGTVCVFDLRSQVGAAEALISSPHRETTKRRLWLAENACLC